jgi:uncharacterized protein with FMN-binding domain
VIALRSAVLALSRSAPRTINGMLTGRGTGKISNDLVAASCATVLAVYAAGYLRTRDAARRFEMQARERRPAVVTQAAPASPRPVVIEAPAPQSGSGYKATPAIASAIKPESKPLSPIAARKPAPKAAVASAAVAAAPLTSVAAPATAVDALTVAAGPSTPSAPREIAPVPLPAEDTTAEKPIAITREPTSGSAPKWRDGTYTGLGDCPHGDIEVRVVIKDGRIVEAGIVTCDTRYPCYVIDPLIHQPVERQSPNVDYMSRATESSDAYYYALVAALDNALERSSSEATIPK